LVENKGKGWVDCKTGKPCGRKNRTAKSKGRLSCVSANYGAMQKQSGQVCGKEQDISQARKLEREEIGYCQEES
jgi:hypothetical protein